MGFVGGKDSSTDATQEISVGGGGCMLKLCGIFGAVSCEEYRRVIKFVSDK